MSHCLCGCNDSLQDYICTQEGWTVIHLAAYYNHKAMLDRLLLPSLHCPRWGLIVDIDDIYHQTPLWFAAKYDCVDCVDVLLVHGANADHKR